MSSPAHRLTGTGALILNTLVAAITYVAFSFIPPFPYQWLAALVSVGVVCSLLNSASFNLPTSSQRSNKRVEGSIKWFNTTKGYGFITGDDGQEVFLHFKSAKGLDKRKIKPGQRFSYRVTSSDRGPQAEHVKPL
jgi:CspA family cold shock protein